MYKIIFFCGICFLGSYVFALDECKLPIEQQSNPHLFLSPIEAGFMHPGYFVPPFVSDEKIASLKSDYLLELYGELRLPSSQEEQFSLIIQPASGILILDGDSSPASDLIDRGFYEEVVSNLEDSFLAIPVEQWKKQDIAKLLVKMAGQISYSATEGLSEGQHLIRQTNRLGAKLKMSDELEFEKFLREKYSADVQTYLFLKKEVEAQIQEPQKRSAVCQGTHICSDEEALKKEFWKHFIVGLQVFQNEYKKLGPEWVKAISLVKKFYIVIIHGTPENTMKKLEKIIEQAQTKFKQDPLEAAANIHQSLVKLHPFKDGNGRMARLMMNVLLRQAGYPSIAMLSEQGYSESVSGRNFLLFVRGRVCGTARAMREMKDSYGSDIVVLSKECVIRMKSYYLEKQTNAENPVLACPKQFAELIKTYQAFDSLTPSEEL